MKTRETLISINDLCFSYQVGSQQVDVLKNLNLQIQSGDFLAIQGPSGSGKSTLFYLLGFMLKPSSGQIRFGGTDTTQLLESQLTLLRNRRIGFVFQQFHLLPRATALENILLPTHYPSEFAIPSEEHRIRAKALAHQLGLSAHLNHLPNQLSGGQQQRVAIARALMNDVDLILADEPTGNLDSQNAAQILDLLTELNQQGKTIILITHDSEVARRCKQVIHVKDGIICEDTPSDPRSQPIATPSRSKENLAANSYSHPIYYTPNLYIQIARSVLPLVGENLKRNKGKSLLTMLGVVIGVAAVLAMITLGQFVKSRILETYETLGVNKLKITGYPNWNLKATDQVVVNFRGFHWDRDFSRIKEIFPELTHVSPLLTTGNLKATAMGGTLDDKVAVMGVHPEFLKLTQRTLIAGNNLNAFQVENQSPVCVVGYEIAERLFSRANPLGQILTLSDGRDTTFPCRIIGVLRSLISPREWTPPNRNVFIPFTYFQATADWWHGTLRDVALQVDPQSDVELTGKKIKSYFEQKYGKAGRFSVDSDSTLVAQMKRFLNLFSLLLASIAFLALLIGGIGIHNMMLVSVTDRIKEFGLRKALGATPHSVRIQVLLESIFLCGGAGTLGVALGFAAYESLIWATTFFVQNIKFEWVIDPFALLLSTLSILSVGIFSGMVPARKAEKFQIIEALRSE